MPGRNYRSAAKGMEGMCWHCKYVGTRSISGRRECKLTGQIVALRGTCDLFENFKPKTETKKRED